jgi:hypothetical protein
MKSIHPHVSAVRPTLVVTLARLAVAVVALASVGSGNLRAHEGPDRGEAKHTPNSIVFTVDVAEDFNLFVPTKVRPEDTQPERGAFFVTEGNVYPSGTIARGGTPEVPGPFDPNGQGAIGKWFCRGTHLVSGALFPTTARAVHTGQLYLLPDEKQSLTTEGLEGAGAIVRAATGGTGPFKGYIGEQRQELLGFNASGGVNLRVTFILKKAVR